MITKIAVTFGLSLTFFALSMIFASKDEVNAQAYNLSASSTQAGCTSNNHTIFRFTWSGPSSPTQLGLWIHEDEIPGPFNEPLVATHVISPSQSSSGSWDYSPPKDLFQYSAIIVNGLAQGVSDYIGVVPSWGSQCRPDLEIVNGSGGTTPAITGPTAVNVGQSVTYTARTRNDDGRAYVTNSSNTRVTTSGSSNNSQNYSVGNLNPSSNSASHSFTTSWATAGTYTVTFTADTGGAVAEDSESNNSESITVVVTGVSNPPPTVDIKANGSDGPITITYNTAATISWTSTNATACSVAPSGWTGTSGSQSSGNLISSRTYTATCVGSGGTAIDSVTVNVTVPATQPDLVVTFLSPASTPIVQGTYPEFRTAVRNIGTGGTAALSNGRFCVDNPGPGCYTSNTGNLGGVLIFPGLAPGVTGPTLNSSNAAANRWLATSGPHTITFCADIAQPPPGAIAESDETAYGPDGLAGPLLGNCLDLSINVTADNSWLDTRSGDVGSEGGLLSGTSIRLPSNGGQTNIDYLAVGTTSISAVFSASRTWLVDDYSVNLPSHNNYGLLETAFASGLTAQAPSGTLPAAPGIVVYGGNLTWTGGGYSVLPGVTCSGGLVVFVRGNITIGTGAQTSLGGNCPTVIVASGNITVNDNVRIINAFLISDGAFDSAQNDTDPALDLTINGGVISSLGAAAAEPKFNRILANNVNPAEILQFKPEYLWFLRDLLGVIESDIREVNP